MARFAIKALPINVATLGNPVENSMSLRPELGEFEIEADSIEQARDAAQARVPSDKPFMICPWREKTACFTLGDRQYVYPTTLYRYNGKDFKTAQGKCLSDSPKSGQFLTKEDAKADYEAHEQRAQAKFDKALEHLEAMNALGVTIDYHMDGDTHGIYEDYMYLEVKEGPYSFEYRYDE